MVKDKNNCYDNYETYRLMECSYLNCKKKAKYKKIIEENPRPLCSKHFEYEKKKYGFVGIRAYVNIKQWEAIDNLK